MVILPYRVWQERFGGRADIIGQELRINRIPAAIIGVTPEHFDFPARGLLWMPLQPTPEMLARKPGGYLAFGRLTDNATQESARAELETINRRLEAEFPVSNKGVRPRVDTYAEFFIGPEASTIYGSLWAASWLVLLIACANLANLTVTRTLGRSREFFTRIALGAGQWRMARHIFTESLMLAIAGGLLGWGLATWGIDVWANATRTPYVVLDYSSHFNTLPYLAMVTIGAALLFGLAPAYKALRVQMGGAQSTGRRAKRLSSALVAVQMALAIVLLSGAGILARSLWNIVGSDTGVTGADKVLTGFVSVSPEDYPLAAARNGFWDRLRADIASIPGVASVALANTTPVGNSRVGAI